MSILSASEAHGIITAFICMNQPQKHNFQNIICNMLDIKQNKRVVFNFVKQLCIYNYEQIKQIDKFLCLLIPNKNEELHIKIKYLKLWLKGFISGLGLFGLNHENY